LYSKLVYSIHDLFQCTNSEALSILNIAVHSCHFAIEHPNTKAATYPQISTSAKTDHLILFADQNGNNKWIVIQRTTPLAAHYFVNNTFTSNPSLTTPPGSNYWAFLQQQCETLIESKTSNKTGIDGLILSSSRPHHFIFDQYVNYISNPKLQALHTVTSDKPFFNRVGTKPKLPIANNQKCYIRPITNDQPRNYNISTLRSAAAPSPYTTTSAPQSSLHIWFSIASEKRGLVNLVQTIEYFVTQLLTQYSHIKLSLEGMTAPIDQKIRSTAEGNLVKKIQATLEKFQSRVEISNYVGLDYPSKIAACAKADGFVSAMGSALLVPLIFCNKKGAVYGLGHPAFHRKIWLEMNYTGADQAYIDVSEYQFSWDRRSFFIPEEILFENFCRELDISHLFPKQDNPSLFANHVHSTPATIEFPKLLLTLINTIAESGSNKLSTELLRLATNLAYDFHKQLTGKPKYYELILVNWSLKISEESNVLVTASMDNHFTNFTNASRLLAVHGYHKEARQVQSFCLQHFAPPQLKQLFPYKTTIHTLVRDTLTPLRQIARKVWRKVSRQLKVTRDS